MATSNTVKNRSEVHIVDLRLMLERFMPVCTGA